MARSTFDGPILSGDNKFGPQRNVGYTELVQVCSMDLTVTTPGANYGGSSGQFVTSAGIPNQAATVYTPSTSVIPPVAQTVTADAAAVIYRGAVFYLPVNSVIRDVVIDVGIPPVVASAGGTSSVTGTTFYASNQFVTSATAGTAYANTASITAAGRAALATFSTQQMYSQLATPIDIPQANGYPNVSQFVITAAIAGSALTSLSATQTVAGAAISNTTGTFTCTSNAVLNNGQLLTISGTAGGTGSIANGTYIVSAISGGLGTVTGFTLLNLNGSAITTTAGTPTGLTYTISSSLAGRFTFAVRYAQLDTNIGSQTVYPYGNFD